MKKGLLFLSIFFLAISAISFVSAQNLSQALSIGQESFARSFSETSLPDSIAQPLKFIFSIPANEDITLTYLIILVALSIFILMVMFSIIQFVPFFSGWKAWVGAVIISAIIAISGGIRESASFLSGFQANLGKWGSVILVFIAIILIILGWGLVKLLKIVRDRVGVETAEKMGEDLSVKPLLEKLREKGLRS